MSLDNLEDAYVNELRDIYNAEQQLVRALPKMAAAAGSRELQEAIEEHLRATRKQVERLEKIFDSLKLEARGRTCAGMEGLIEEGNEIMGEKGRSDARDAALIATTQKVEHYEIASYGTLSTWAVRLDHRDHAKLLQESLAEEKSADRRLTEIAERRANSKAAH